MNDTALVGCTPQLCSNTDVESYVFAHAVFKKEQKGKKEAAAETKRKKSDTASETEPESKRQKTEADKEVSEEKQKEISGKAREDTSQGAGNGE